MTKRLNMKEILASGTIKQKALLIIENEEASVRQSGAFLTDFEVRQIIDSAKKNPNEARELTKYLTIAEKYMLNRFRIYGLQENLKKLSARIAGFCYIWELAEQEAEFCNVLLGLIDTDGVKGVSKVSHKADVEKYIYQTCKGWNRYVHIKRRKDEKGNELRDVEVDTTQIMEIIKGIVADYASSLGVAKAFVIASEEFTRKYNASAFIPEDVKEYLEYFSAPNTDVPDIYRRDSYLKLLEEKGEEDREVQYREKYAVLPAWSEVEPIGLNNAREAFSL